MSEPWMMEEPRLNKNHDFNILLDAITGLDVDKLDSSALKCLIDMIDNENKVTPKQAVAAISIKIKDQNPRTVILALEVLKAVFYNLGNTVHEIIVTDDYMEFLKKIIYSTEHQTVRDRILETVEDWAKMLEYFTKYNAPLELIKVLQAEKYVFSQVQGQSDINKKMQTDSKDNELALNSNNEQELLEKQLKERNEREKQKYREFRKANNMPTSSDEEDVETKEKNPDEQIEEKKITKSLLKKLESIKNENEQIQEKKLAKTLPKELESIKNQRLRLEANVRKVRMQKHEANSCDHELQQCKKNNCKDCEKFRKKPEENIVIEKRLPKVFQKIKDSRAEIKNSFEEIKELKKKDYYKNLTSNQNQNTLPITEIQNGHKLGGVPPSKSDKENRITRAEQEEDENLRRALEISVYDTGNGGSVNPYEIDDDDDDQNDLQQSMPKLTSEEENWDSLLEKEINLLIENEADEYCLFCSTTMFLKKFQHCNHQCVCEDCIFQYNVQKCPICATKRNMTI